MPIWVLKKRGEEGSSPKARSEEGNKNQSENCVSPTVTAKSTGGRSNLRYPEEPAGEIKTHT